MLLRLHAFFHEMRVECFCEQQRLACSNLYYPLSWNNIFSDIGKSLLPIPPVVPPVRSREDWRELGWQARKQCRLSLLPIYVEAWLLCIHLASVRSFKCHPSLRRTLIRSNGTVSLWILVSRNKFQYNCNAALTRLWRRIDAQTNE